MDGREQAEQHLTQPREGRLDQRKACGGGNGVADVGTRTRFGQPYLAGVPLRRLFRKGALSPSRCGGSNVTTYSTMSGPEPGEAIRRMAPTPLGSRRSEPVHRHRQPRSPPADPGVVAQRVPHGVDRCGDGGLRCDLHSVTLGGGRGVLVQSPVV